MLVDAICQLSAENVKNTKVSDVLSVSFYSNLFQNDHN